MGLPPRARTVGVLLASRTRSRPHRRDDLPSTTAEETCQTVQTSFVGGTNGCAPPERAACPQYDVGTVDGTTTFLAVVPYLASTVEFAVDSETVKLAIEQADGFTFATATTTVALTTGFVLHVDGSPVCQGS